MDNAKYYLITETLQFYEEKKIKLIDWPPYSPDLNSIDNIWVKMKWKIYKKRIRNYEKV